MLNKYLHSGEILQLKKKNFIQKWLQNIKKIIIFKIVKKPKLINKKRKRDKNDDKDNVEDKNEEISSNSENENNSFSNKINEKKKYE